MDISSTVRKAVASAPVWDFHTHLYPPSFGSPCGRGVAADPEGLMLWGIDELLTYHYLIAELFRETTSDELPIEAFWQMNKPEQADLIWRRLFVEQTPLSEACRGVVTTLIRLGLDPSDGDLGGIRAWFAKQSPDEQIDRVLELSQVVQVTMTNDPFDENERSRWLSGSATNEDSRFHTVLRLDPLVVDWPLAAERLAGWGYGVDAGQTGSTIEELRRFLREWVQRIQPAYFAMSLPPSWRYPLTPASDERNRAGERSLVEAILPVCREHGLPLALMIGVNRGVNPAIRLAGDAVEQANVPSLAALCRDHPDQRVLCTMLSKENQYELTVTARKFRNLTPFGCWWFLNTPASIEEITRSRLELLGASFIPQHSDARILEQLIYKWDHNREAIARALIDQYEQVQLAGYQLTENQVRRDAERLLHGNVRAALA